MIDEPVYHRSDVLWRRTYDRVLILVPGRDGILTLQGSGRDLWAALEEPGSVGALSQRLAAVYTAPVEQIASDIVPVIEDLARRGAVNVSTDP
jgi:hypothetical protein